MKKRILTLAFVVVTLASSAFANNEVGVSQTTIEAFNKEFPAAKEIKWENSKDYAKATFSLNSQVMFAYYNPDGKLIGISRNLLSSQLPINLAADLKKSYDGFWITDLFEMASDNETTYYATLESTEHVLIIKSNGMNGWSVYQKDKKKI